MAADETTGPQYSAGQYSSVVAQADNEEQRGVGDHLKRCVAALVLAR